jgi:integrase
MRCGVQSLFSLCLSSNGNSVRNTLILLFLFDCGLRVSELTGIELDDINLEEGTIKIRKAKGSQELGRYYYTGNSEAAPKPTVNALYATTAAVL